MRHREIKLPIQTVVKIQDIILSATAGEPSVLVLDVNEDSPVLLIAIRKDQAEAEDK